MFKAGDRVKRRNKWSPVGTFAIVVQVEYLEGEDYLWVDINGREEHWAAVNAELVKDVSEEELAEVRAGLESWLK